MQVLVSRLKLHMFSGTVGVYTPYKSFHWQLNLVSQVNYGILQVIERQLFSRLETHNPECQHGLASSSAANSQDSFCYSYALYSVDHWIRYIALICEWQESPLNVTLRSVWSPLRFCLDCKHVQCVVASYYIFPSSELIVGNSIGRNRYGAKLDTLSAVFFGLVDTDPQDQKWK